jgi:uncharacterized protein with PIN domain
MDSSTALRFACDAMLGGLTRWLRAAGYDAFWQLGIDDRELIRLSRETGRVLLSSDTRLFEFAVLRDGEQPALFVPLRLSPLEQLGFVLAKLRLSLREPRCMVCGGELVEMPREQVKDLVPPRTFAWLERFWQCAGCGKVFWHGTHWQRIAKALEQVASGRA